MIYYLATPYTRYPAGVEAAYRDACKLAARLIVANVVIYSPIAHTHGIAVHGHIDPLDQRFWYDFDHAMLEACTGLIVAHMDGWEQSTGIAEEIRFFEEHNKPIYDLDPDSFALARRPNKSCLSGLDTQGLDHEAF